jgi:hypothetical protein
MLREQPQQLDARVASAADYPCLDHSKFTLRTDADRFAIREISERAYAKLKSRPEAAFSMPGQEPGC